jgi:hypothetical protein
MALDNPKGGMGYAAEFQSSALPWVTSSTAPSASSPVRYDFPKLTRFITVYNRDTTTTNTLSFGFTRRGVVSSNNKYILNGGKSETLELRVKSIYLQGETGNPPFSVCAGLTNIDASVMPLLSETLSNGDAGWLGVG